MAAPTNTANVKKSLANSEPSTHGTSETFVGTADRSGLHCKAEVEVATQAAVPGGGGATIPRNNPVQMPIHQSLRCGARTRSGDPCRSPAMPNGRCRMHGGKSPGAPKGNRNAWKHGYYSAETMAVRKLVRQLLLDSVELLSTRL